ncbi:MAG: helix-turn-helix domain-containing protein [Candidatus Bathyarchaeia archaeon]
MDTLFDVLGNETRRRIIRLLAEEPRYLLQLAKELEVSQQAILKHMELLKRYGLVNAYEADSELAAPPRKYYALARSFYMTVGLAGDTCYFRTYEVPPRVKEPAKCPIELKRLEDRLQELEKVSDIAKSLEMADSLICEINRETERLEEAEAALFCLRQKALNLAHKRIREASTELLEREILYNMLGSDRQVDVDLLAEELKTREKKIRDALAALQKRLHFLEKKTRIPDA